MTNVMKLTPQDILAEKIVQPNQWYTVQCTSAKAGTSNKDNSTFWTFILTIQGGPFQGVPLRAIVSEKYVGAAIPMLTAFNGGKDVAAGDFNIDSLVGRRCKVKVATGEYNGKPTNEIVQYDVA